MTSRKNWPAVLAPRSSSCSPGRCCVPNVAVRTPPYRGTRDDEVAPACRKGSRSPQVFKAFVQSVTEDLQLCRVLGGRQQRHLVIRDSEEGEACAGGGAMQGAPSSLPADSEPPDLVQVNAGSLAGCHSAGKGPRRGPQTHLLCGPGAGTRLHTSMKGDDAAVPGGASRESFYVGTRQEGPACGLRWQELLGSVLVAGADTFCTFARHHQRRATLSPNREQLFCVQGLGVTTLPTEASPHSLRCIYFRYHCSQLHGNPGRAELLWPAAVALRRAASRMERPRPLVTSEFAVGSRSQPSQRAVGSLGWRRDFGGVCDPFKSTVCWKRPVAAVWQADGEGSLSRLCPPQPCFLQGPATPSAALLASSPSHAVALSSGPWFCCAEPPVPLMVVGQQLRSQPLGEGTGLGLRRRVAPTCPGSPTSPPGSCHSPHFRAFTPQKLQSAYADSAIVSSAESGKPVASGGELGGCTGLCPWLPSTAVLCLEASPWVGLWPRAPPRWGWQAAERTERCRVSVRARRTLDFTASAKSPLHEGSPEGAGCLGRTLAVALERGVQHAAARTHLEDSAGSHFLPSLWLDLQGSRGGHVPMTAETSIDAGNSLREKHRNVGGQARASLQFHAFAVMRWGVRVVHRPLLPQSQSRFSSLKPGSSLESEEHRSAPSRRRYASAGPPPQPSPGTRGPHRPSARALTGSRNFRIHPPNLQNLFSPLSLEDPSLEFLLMLTVVP
ncbi:hypothetical protein CB1_000977006 [Camelus ferus]|nr:hypothetical protein CB1_000977006 [Camelus ferus]